jgi:ribulose-5-phosphate 4-epimerase/fuculose-1-phosphate aldolase
MMRKRLLGPLALALICCALATQAPAQGLAGSTPQAGSPAPLAEPALIGDLVAGSRILADLGVVDAFGHLTARSPTNPNHFLMSRSLAPALVTADDIMEFDLDGNAIDPRGRTLFLERFIHAEIYRARPDVMAVVHSHSLGVIPFSVSSTKLGAMYHNAAFLAGGVPVFDIHDAAGETDMLIRNSALGAALARTLADKPVALMRGHGDIAVGPDIPTAVFRAYYTDVDARLQMQAIALGGTIRFLSPEEGRQADIVNAQILPRAWNLWKQKVGH